MSLSWGSVRSNAEGTFGGFRSEVVEWSVWGRKDLGKWVRAGEARAVSKCGEGGGLLGASPWGLGRRMDFNVSTDDS